jgi:hypothetical protein
MTRKCGKLAKTAFTSLRGDEFDLAEIRQPKIEIHRASIPSDRP